MKVSISLSGTFLVDEASKQYIKTFVEFRDIDTEQDIETQLKQGETTVDAAWSRLTKKVIEKTKETFGKV